VKPWPAPAAGVPRPAGRAGLRLFVVPIACLPGSGAIHRRLLPGRLLFWRRGWRGGRRRALRRPAERASAPPSARCSPGPRPSAARSISCPRPGPRPLINPKRLTGTDLADADRAASSPRRTMARSRRRPLHLQNPGEFSYGTTYAEADDTLHVGTNRVMGRHDERCGKHDCLAVAAIRRRYLDTPVSPQLQIGSYRL
jgi:hypothetical protein